MEKGLTFTNGEKFHPSECINQKVSTYLAHQPDLWLSEEVTLSAKSSSTQCSLSSNVLSSNSERRISLKSTESADSFFRRLPRIRSLSTGVCFGSTAPLLSMEAKLLKTIGYTCTADAKKYEFEITPQNKDKSTLQKKMKSDYYTTEFEKENPIMFKIEELRDNVVTRQQEHNINEYNDSYNLSSSEDSETSSNLPSEKVTTNGSSIALRIVGDRRKAAKDALLKICKPDKGSTRPSLNETSIIGTLDLSMKNTRAGKKRKKTLRNKSPIVNNRLRTKINNILEEKSHDSEKNYLSKKKKSESTIASTRTMSRSSSSKKTQPKKRKIKTAITTSSGKKISKNHYLKNRSQSDSKILNKLRDKTRAKKIIYTSPPSLKNVKASKKIQNKKGVSSKITEKKRPLVVKPSTIVQTGKYNATNKGSIKSAKAEYSKKNAYKTSAGVKKKQNKTENIIIESKKTIGKPYLNISQSKSADSKNLNEIKLVRCYSRH